VDITFVAGDINRLHAAYAPKKLPNEFVLDIWTTVNEDLETPCVFYLEGNFGDPQCKPFIEVPFSCTTHLENFSDRSVNRVIIVTGNYLTNNKNRVAENTSQDFTSLRFPESFEQLKLLESELLFDTHYTSVAVKDRMRATSQAKSSLYTPACVLIAPLLLLPEPCLSCCRA
jgi:hypothetical protein